MSSQPKWPWITLIVLQTIQILSLVPWLAVAGFAVMAFDSPGSMQMWQPWLFVLAIWSYPGWLLVAAVISWLLVSRRPMTAVVIGAIVTLPMPLLLLVLLVANH